MFCILTCAATSLAGDPTPITAINRAVKSVVPLLANTHLNSLKLHIGISLFKTSPNQRAQTSVALLTEHIG